MSDVREVVLVASATVPVSNAADALAPLVADPGRSALFLDLDGTLAPIVARPQDAKVIDGARPLLERLQAHLGLLGFVSGRGLADLQRIVGLPGCAYAGNHGFEIRRPGAPATTVAAAAAWQPAIDRLAAEWTDAVLAPDGLVPEPKGATLSVHWRTAPDRDRAQAALHDRLAPAAEAAGLVVTWGRMVMEIRPPAAIDKGTAVRELLSTAPIRHAAYVGDDRTDADAWRALHQLRGDGALTTGVAVAVMSAEAPPELLAAADVGVNGPAEVRELLAVLADRVDAGAAAPRTN
jgi:trehalose 6-phosphate phosphatase